MIFPSPLPFISFILFFISKLQKVFGIAYVGTEKSLKITLLAFKYITDKRTQTFRKIVKIQNRDKKFALAEVNIITQY